MDEIAHHFFGREVIEHPQHSLEEHTLLSTTQLTRYDDAGMELSRFAPLLMKWREIANVETEDGAALVRGEGELFLVRGSIFAGFFGGEDVESTPAQVDSEAGHDMAVEVETNE